MDPDIAIEERIRNIAESLDAITEDDLLALAGITHGTASAWRKRGTGPAYVILGNRVLYPRPQLKDFLADLIRERRNVPAKAVL